MGILTGSITSVMIESSYLDGDEDCEVRVEFFPEQTCTFVKRRLGDRPSLDTGWDCLQRIVPRNYVVMPFPKPVYRTVEEMNARTRIASMNGG